MFKNCKNTLVLGRSLAGSMAMSVVSSKAVPVKANNPADGGPKKAGLNSTNQEELRFLTRSMSSLHLETKELLSMAQLIGAKSLGVVLLMESYHH